MTPTTSSNVNKESKHSTKSKSVQYLNIQVIQNDWIIFKESIHGIILGRECPNSIVIEYAEDLEYYWIDGYGFPLTYKQACITIGDMFDHLSGNSTMPAATFYFTHSGTLLKLLAHLGLYKDKAAIMHKRNANREWRVSKIDAFGTNLAFIKFNCDGEENILVLHQERPVKIPGCPKKSDLCPLKTLKTIFTDSIHKCDFKATCSLPVVPST